MDLRYSFIIPVYNRPEEVRELLESFTKLYTNIPFEIVLVEDGSTKTSERVVREYAGQLDIKYLVKFNSGPGDSRNFGMRHASGTYFIILDSDCILPETYLAAVHYELNTAYVDFFGGPDAAHPSFSVIQKAINYTMTSFLTTGGIRGGSQKLTKFQPRSFNMGISKEAFEKSGGFGKIHPGEDPDLVLRLWKAGYKSRLLPEAFVYHKRRISWEKFQLQVHKFGLVRPILNRWHPESKKWVFWLPTLFIIGVIISFAALLFGFPYLMYVLVGYNVLLFIHAFVTTKSLKVSAYAVKAMWLQFFGYGKAYLLSTVEIGWRKKPVRKRFPKLFFN